MAEAMHIQELFDGVKNDLGNKKMYAGQFYTEVGNAMFRFSSPSNSSKAVVWSGEDTDKPFTTRPENGCLILVGMELMTTSFLNISITW